MVSDFILTAHTPTTIAFKISKSEFLPTPCELVFVAPGYQTDPSKLTSTKSSVDLVLQKTELSNIVNMLSASLTSPFLTELCEWVSEPCINVKLISLRPLTFTVNYHCKHRNTTFAVMCCNFHQSFLSVGLVCNFAFVCDCIYVYMCFVCKFLCTCMPVYTQSGQRRTLSVLLWSSDLLLWT